MNPHTNALLFLAAMKSTGTLPTLLPPIAKPFTLPEEDLFQQVNNVPSSEVAAYIQSGQFQKDKERFMPLPENSHLDKEYTDVTDDTGAVGHIMIEGLEGALEGIFEED